MEKTGREGLRDGGKCLSAPAASEEYAEDAVSEALKLHNTCWLHGAMIFFLTEIELGKRGIVFFETLEKLRPLLLRSKGSSQRR